MIRSITSFLLLSAIVIATSACGSGTSYNYYNDYSDAPVLVDVDTAAITSWVTENGLSVYVIETGDSTQLQVGIRDVIRAKYTTRNASVDDYRESEDAIIQSTYVNGSTSATSISSLGSQSVIYYVSSTLIDGIEGMYEGERRVLFFPDSLTTFGQPIAVDFELESVTY